MLATYKAILRGNQLEWHEQTPPPLTHLESVTVFVTLLNEQKTDPEKAAQGIQMSAALSALAALPSPTVLDPLIWEREQREERSLPQRP
ncbi:MAG: hypothetical protein GY796_10430 [Chloroflexi bacterium]|nr:hypothetical protein [Chloroflexota bacterium]